MTALAVLVLVMAFAGSFLGQLLACRLDKRRPRPKEFTVRPPAVELPSNLEDEAARWVRQRGYPDEAIPLVADKARLIYRIVHSRRYRGRRS